MSGYKYLYSVATGAVDPFRKASRAAARCAWSCEGFVAVHPAGPYGVLWLYDSENHAKAARNILRSHGAECGRNICRFKWDGGDALIPDFEA